MQQHSGRKGGVMGDDLNKTEPETGYVPAYVVKSASGFYWNIENSLALPDADPPGRWVSKQTKATKFFHKTSAQQIVESFPLAGAKAVRLVSKTKRSCDWGLR